VELDVAGVGDLEPIAQAKKRGLAGAGRSDNHIHPGSRNLEVADG
jgi:hypothetical protein